MEFQILGPLEVRLEGGQVPLGAAMPTHVSDAQWRRSAILESAMPVAPA